MLAVVGTAGGLGLLAGGSSAQDGEPDDRSYAVLQGDRCLPVAPLEGDRPVEEFYEYTYPQGSFEGPPGASGNSYSSEGTVDLQRERTSVLFLYEGPEGVSLVFVHGRVDEEELERPAGESEAGGTISFGLRGLPADGEWVVIDDSYTVDGEQHPSNYDRWDLEGESDLFHWAYRGGRTDGAVFRGLSERPDVTLAPAFNEAAGLADEFDLGTVERWELLSGDVEDPERRELELDEPIRIAAGPCPEDGG